MLVEDLKEGRRLGLEMQLSLSFDTVLDDTVLMFLARQILKLVAGSAHEKVLTTSYPSMLP